MTHSTAPLVFTDRDELPYTTDLIYRVVPFDRAGNFGPSTSVKTRIEYPEGPCPDCGGPGDGGI